MSTSGTTTYFNTLETIDVIQEAFERTGMQFSQVSGNQMDSARRSLQFLISDWSNKGPNLWRTILQTFPLTSGVNTITLTNAVIEMLQVYVRDASASPSIDYIITGISRADYDALPYKTQSGHRPTQFYFERTITPTCFLWPVQDNNNITLYAHNWLIQQDVGALTNQFDAPNRWLEAAAANLAERLAVKFAPDRLPILQPLARDAFNAAAAEDVESVPLRIVPDMMGHRF